MWLQLLLLSIYNCHNFIIIIIFIYIISRNARYVCGFKWRYGCGTYNLGGASGLKGATRKFTQIFFWNFRFKLYIAWCVSWSLVQKMLSPLHRYVLVLTLVTNIQLCLLITQAIVLKLGIHNSHHNNVLSVCWCSHFSLHLEVFFISVTGFSRYYVKYNRF